MLCITRRVGETIVVGEEDQIAFITIGKAERGVIKLLIQAPREVRVDRMEIWLKKTRDNRGKELLS